MVTLCLPPLRERKEDIPALVQHFIEKYNTQFGLNVTDVDVNVREFFYAYDWPGNVRELEHIIEGSMNLIEDETIITAFHLPTSLSRTNKNRIQYATCTNYSQY